MCRNKKSGSIYFLHIPKTSGASITEEIRKHYGSQVIGEPNIFPADELPPNTRTTQIREEIACGHFALNPFGHMEFAYSFSIVREPVSRLISLYSYHHRTDAENLYNKKLFMNFVFNTHPRIDAIEFAGFDGQPNSQSSYLSTKIQIDAYGFKHLPESLPIEKVFESIDKNNIDVFTLDNRGALIEKLSDMLGSTIADIHINASPKVGFELTKHEISEILKLNHIDHELYEKLREKETCSN